MTTFNQLFAQSANQNPIWQTQPQHASVADLDFNHIHVDSRRVQAGDVFVLLKSQDPKTIYPTTIAPEKISQYLAQANNQKVAFVLTEIDLDNVVVPIGLNIIYTPDIRDYLGELIQANLQAGQPAQLPTVIATTGTNGKTTVSQLVAQLISQSGKKTAVMGTAGNGLIDNNGQLNLVPATHTTLEVANLQHAIYDFAKQGVQVLSIEASSHGLYQQRLQGVPITVAIFTNLSRDHLDYHSDMDDYARAKARLFDKNLFPSLTHAVINLDDDFSELMINTAKNSGLTVWTYSLSDRNADFFAKTITPSLNGVDLTITTPQGDLTVKSPLLGRFNVANLLASVAGAMALGLTIEQIETAIPQLKGATGRMDRVPSANPQKQGCFIVDYAHTPDALEQVLTSLKPHCDGELWAVFGCGGDRDKGKRPLMAQVALKLADKVILTADNPRSEDPQAILKDMQDGMTCEQHYQAVIEPDRKTAIAYAVQNAKPNDIVVIAGKGHETYQEINGVRYDFDDKQVVAEALQQFEKM